MFRSLFDVSAPRPRTKRRAALTAIALAASGLTIFATAAPSVADTVPTGGLPATVSADGLPTVQINGVVWAQVVVGNTVYATGSFTQATPAGVKLGGAGTVTRSNLLAYDITTGVLNTSFNHTLNDQGLAIAVSPDNSRLYVGGSFTTVDGATHNRIAAFSLATGALDTSFTASLNSTVHSLAVTNSTVYVGGGFTTANSTSRSHLAALTSGGTLTSWVASANSGVNAMTLTPDGTRLIVGGSFTTLVGTTALGMGSVSSSTGAIQPWAANTVIQDSGTSSDIDSLVTDGTQIYGSGYYNGRGGNFEGRFAANPNTGAIVWMNSCHGDTYSSVPLNGVLYSAGHEHDCSDISAFSQDDRNVFSSTHHFVAAEATTPSGAVLRHALFAGGMGLPGPMYADFAGQPSTTQLNWYPALTEGTYTGASQAAWSVAGNSSYLVVGGEFPTVNGVAQQGLVRFAVSSIAPNKVGPTAASSLTPIVYSQSAGTARVAWQATSDEDNTTLTYALYRDSSTTPIYTKTLDSYFWNRPNMGFLDTGLAAGSSHSYKVKVTDPLGNSITSASKSVTIGSTGPDTYTARVIADGASHFWPLSEAKGTTTAADKAGNADLTLGGSITLGAAGPVSGSSATGATFAGGETTPAPTGQPGPPPLATPNDTAGTTGTITPGGDFSTEAWVKTTSTQGGEIIGLGLYRSADSQAIDKTVYMDNTGKILFGVQNNTADQTLTSTTSYNDGKWHLVDATFGSGTATLFVDGAQVASSSGLTDNIAFPGYWRIGGDLIGGWPSSPSTGYLAGTIADAAVYPSAISSAVVAGHYTLGTGGVVANQPPKASFTTSCTQLVCSLDGSGSTDSDGTIASYAWTFGDGATATGATANHTYAVAGTYPVTLTVTDNGGLTGSSTQSLTVATVPGNQPPTASFTTSCTQLACSVNGSGSTDSDGTIASYAWTFGDGGTATGATANHTYAAAGTYPVTLTVTDNGGLTGSSTQNVTVTAAAVTTLADDLFGRTVTGGFGTAAPTGGAWTNSDTAANLGVSPGAGTLTVAAGAKAGAYLGSVSANRVDILTSVTLNKLPVAGNGYYFYVVARRVSATEQYFVRARILATGAIKLSVSKFDGSASEVTLGTEITAPGTVVAGSPLNIRVEANGVSPTTVQARVWTGATEPTTWAVTTTDSSAALQASGSVGVRGTLSSSVTNGPIVGSVARFTAIAD